jgi:hypothetical protein
MAKHPAADHHQKAADKHREAGEAHDRARQSHEQGAHEDASEHAEQAGQHATEAVQHGQRAKDAYNPSGQATRTDLPPEASGLKGTEDMGAPARQNPGQAPPKR